MKPGSMQRDIGRAQFQTGEQKNKGSGVSVFLACLQGIAKRQGPGVNFGGGGSSKLGQR